MRPLEIEQKYVCEKSVTMFKLTHNTAPDKCCLIFLKKINVFQKYINEEVQRCI